MFILFALARFRTRPRKLFCLILFGFLVSFPCSVLSATETGEGPPEVTEEFADLSDEGWLEEEPAEVFDPLEPVNRAFSAV